VISKWAYEAEITKKTKVILGVHQEDTRIACVSATRPYLDIGVVILKKAVDGTLSLVADRSLNVARQNELEVDLEAGNYVFLPRTTGCLLKRPADTQKKNIKLMTNGVSHDLFISAIKAVFRNFDIFLDRSLGCVEFGGLFKDLGKTELTEAEFYSDILTKFTSTSDGLTERGLIEFFMNAVQTQGEETVWAWFEKLGFDRDLFNGRQRSFIFTMHSDHEVNMTIKDASVTNYDYQANVLLLKRDGIVEINKGIRVFYLPHKDANAFSYGVQNDQLNPVLVTLECSDSKGMLFSSKTSRVQKRIEAGGYEFIMHATAIPTEKTYVRATKCAWKPLRE